MQLRGLHCTTVIAVINARRRIKVYAEIFESFDESSTIKVAAAPLNHFTGEIRESNFFLRIETKAGWNCDRKRCGFQPWHWLSNQGKAIFELMVKDLLFQRHIVSVGKLSDGSKRRIRQPKLGNPLFYKSLG
jgi:hypothetical protein